MKICFFYISFVFANFFQKVNIMVVNTKLYDVLGVQTDVDQKILKKRWRELVLIHHPDKNDGDDAKFKEIDMAYKVLADPKTRKIYDQIGTLDKQTSLPTNNAFSFDIFNVFNGMGAGFPQNFSFQSSFNPQQHQRTKTDNMMLEIKVTLEEIYTGIEKTIRVKRRCVCQNCSGVGGKAKNSCDKCNGTGKLMSQQMHGNMYIQQMHDCTYCSSRGYVIPEEKKCKICQGEGYTFVKQPVAIKLPPGVANGYTLVLKNMADEQKGLKTGDLLFVVKEVPHKTFQRQGADLVINFTIDLKMALIGGLLEFKHLDETISKVTLMKGKVIHTGHTMVLQNKGMPLYPHKKFGDLRVKFNVEMPDDDWAKNVSSEKVKELFM